MRQYPLARNARLVLPDQPVSLVWSDLSEDDPEGKMIYRCRAACGICGAQALSWATLGWPDCEEDELDCLEQLEEQGCPHVEPMRTYLGLLLLEHPVTLA